MMAVGRHKGSWRMMAVGQHSSGKSCGIGSFAYYLCYMCMGLRLADDDGSCQDFSFLLEEPQIHFDNSPVCYQDDTFKLNSAAASCIFDLSSIENPHHQPSPPSLSQ